MFKFSPLGNFNPTAPLDPKVVAIAKAFEAKLPAPPPGHGLKRIYGHWTAAPMNCDFSDYNGETKSINGSHVLTLEHNPLDQIPGVNADPMIAATWHRNTASIACAITGMDDATEGDFGPDPITVAGLVSLCSMIGAFAHRYDIDVTARVQAADSTTHLDNFGKYVNTKGEWVLLTHGEVAVIDGYAGERWDLASFVPVPPGVVLTPDMRSRCGDALRIMSRRFTLALAA